MKPGWRRYAPLAHAERRRIAGLAALSLVGIAIDVLLPWPLKLVIDHVLPDQALPASARWIAGLPGAGSAGGLLAWLAGMLLLLALAVQLIQLARGVLHADVSARLRLALGALVFEQVQALSMAWHRRSRKGDLLRRVTADSACLPTIVTEVLLPVFTAAIMLVALFAIMWRLDPALALVAAAVAGPMLIAMRALAPRMTDRAYAQQQAEGGLWAVTEQTLTALPLVQSFGSERAEQSRFDRTAAQTVHATLRNIATQLQYRIGIDGIEAVGIAAVMVVGGWHVLDGRLTVGTLVVFLSYLAALYAPLLSFAYMASTVASAAASARRVEQVLDADDRVADAPQALPLPAPRGGAALCFDGIVFGYETGRPVLRGVDLEVRAGEMLALVGASGAGKTTLAALVPRLHDPWRGRGSIDGPDLRDVTLASIREHVAVVLQDALILPISVADNIAYGRPSATRAEIESAACAARCDAFVDALPQGYDTVVGERGTTLSGGQRQRIAIARALLKNAPVLVMDEPTRALDTPTERDVLDALQTLTRGRTTIVIAHRLDTMLRADRIAVLDGGRIVETGTHDALLAAGGRYRALVGGQTGIALAAQRRRQGWAA